MQKPYFCAVDYSNMPIGNIVIHIQNNMSDFIMNLIFMCVLWI